FPVSLQTRGRFLVRRGVFLRDARSARKQQSLNAPTQIVTAGEILPARQDPLGKSCRASRSLPRFILDLPKLTRVFGDFSLSLQNLPTRQDIAPVQPSRKTAH